MEFETDETTIAEDGKPEDPPIENMEVLKQENSKLRELVRLRDAKDELTAVLAKTGARSPGLLFAYAVDDLQFDDAGKLANREAVVAKLRSSFPEQFGTDTVASVDAGAGAGRGTPPLTREALARMSPAEISKLDWAAVREAIGRK